VRASAGPTVKAFRVLTRFPVFVCLVCLCFCHCLLRTLARKSDAASRAAVLQRWCRRISSCFRVEPSVLGSIPTRGMIVSNHLSYLDILVFSSVAGCAFISKREIKSWPFVGWIASMTGTIFIDRSRRSQTHSLQPQMQKHLASGVPILLFPEATSTDGREILPFRSSFFEPAVAVSAPITAAHLSYEMPDGDGDPVMDICYWGDMTLMPQFFKLLAKSRVKAIVYFSDHPRVFSDRKIAAREMHDEVVELGKAKSRSTQMVLQ